MVSSFILDKMSPCRQEQNRQNQGIMSKPVESFSNSANTTSVLHGGIHENFALVLINNDWYPEGDEIYISSRIKLGRARLWLEFDQK